MPDRYFILRGLLLALLGFAFTIPNTSHATGSAGLYSDANGFSCSFNGNDPGVVTAYVVVRPDEDGMRAVRFAVPVPDCFGGTWLGDSPSDGVNVIGNSTTGVALATGFCSTTPQMMMTVYYQRTGSTTPCCDFSLQADPFVSMVEITTCNLNTEEATPITSHMNADASCPCMDDVAPLPPSDPLPYDTQTMVLEWPNLHWVGQDWNGDIVEYDVYLGTSSNPPFAGTAAAAVFEPSAALAPLTLHYWRVVARDSKGNETSGPVWRFTTGPHNHPPTINLISPAEGATNIPLLTTLSWSGNDIDFHPMWFDVYLGKTNPPALVASGITSSVYSNLSPLDFATDYFWRVVVKDGPHSETSSPVRTFKTADGNNPPNVPVDPTPADLADNVALNQILSATTTDPNNDPLTTDVYFGTVNPPPLVAQNVPVGPGSITSYNPGALANDQTYYWKFVVRDSKGGTNTGAIWIFKTDYNEEPYPPSITFPAHGSTGQSTSLTLLWTGEDPDPGQTATLRYDVYLGTGVPSLFRTNLASPSLAVTLQPNTTYNWRVVARDLFGATASNVVRTFSTGTGPVNLPPTVPSNPAPPNNGVVPPASTNLVWSSTDPEGQPLSFLVFFGTTNPPPIAGVVTSPSFFTGPLVQGQRYYWSVYASDGVNPVQGPVWTFFVDSFVPVLFSSFNAKVSGSAALVQWELQSDEAMASYTLYRREKGKSLAVEVWTAAVSDSRDQYLDRTVEDGKSYEYQLLVRTTDGDEFRSQTATVEMPVLELGLGQNRPNPFNPQTTIPYTVPNAGGLSRVRIAIYDASGHLVRTLIDEDQAGGSREVTWNGTDANNQGVTSGVYFCVLQVDKERRTQKMVLLK